METQLVERAFRTVAFGVLALCSATTASVQTARAAALLPLHVHLEDSARLPAGVVDRALRVASDIFDRAAIVVRWELPADAGATKAAPLETIEKRDVTRLSVVRIVRASSYGRAGALGFTFSGTRLTTVVYPRVEHVATASGLDVALVLGHVIAHELGHQLLGHSRHAAAGLMQPTLDVHRAAQGRLAFNGAEVEAIRAALSAAAVGAPTD